jgi:hypothetical protein
MPTTVQWCFHTAKTRTMLADCTHSKLLLRTQKMPPAATARMTQIDPDEFDVQWQLPVRFFEFSIDFYQISIDFLSM